MKSHKLGISALRLFAFVLIGSLAANVARSQETSTRPVDRIKIENLAKQQPKIVGGIEAPPGKYTFQVALISVLIPAGQEHFGQFCGGSLIDRSWILTAAHCVPGTEPEEVDIYMGSNVLPTQGQPTGERLHVDAIISHLDYNPSTQDNDIALLHLATSASPMLKTAVVATPDLDAQYVFPLGDAVVIGWGRTSEGGNSSPNLMRVWVDVQDSAQCESNYRTQFPSVNITDNMFCAGLPQGGKDSCQGDSGGFLGAPLGGGDYVQLGIVSWGVGCARPDLFGVYTRVGNYKEWIETEIAAF